MDKVVVSLGGSVLVPDEQDDDYISHLSSLLRSLRNRYELYAVCGGGRVARYYIETGRKLGMPVATLDEMGIDVTRVNARLLRSALGEAASPAAPATIGEAAAAGGPGRIVVMGGTVPGHTTDGVASMLAEAVGASRIVNATSVDGVYDSDPRGNPSAKRYARLTFQELADIIGTEHGAGRNAPFDPLGASIVMRRRIPLMVLAGRDLRAVKKAIIGEEFDGTLIDG